MEQPLPSAGGYSNSRHHATVTTPAAAANQQLHHQHSQLFPSHHLPSPAQLLPTQPFPPGWYHRTSSSRHELYPPVTVKRESIGTSIMQKDNAAARTSLDDAMPSTSDFVKKLYKMLEDQSFQHVVSWGPQGDCFVVKDMNEFTKSILPRLFKHSNFASFVRQLNKYDFHKVKNTDDLMQFGEQSWTFRHPDFHADRREALENIKRKVPAQRKQQQQAAAAAAAASSSSSSLPHVSSSSHHRRHHSRRHRSRSPTYSQYSRSASPDPAQIHELQTQIAVLQGQLRARETRERELEERMRALERGQGEISQGLVGLQRGLAMQDRMVQGLVGGWVGVDGQGTDPKSQPSNLDPVPGGLGLRTQPSSSSLQPQAQAQQTSTAPAPLPSLSSVPTLPPIGASLPQNQQYAPFLPAPAAPLGSGSASGMGMGVDRPEDVARASLVRIGEYSRRHREQGQSGEQEEYVLPTPSQRDWDAGASGAAGTATGSEMGGPEHEALQVYTVGHLMPRSEDWYQQQPQQGQSQSSNQNRGRSRSRNHSRNQSQSQHSQGRYGFSEGGESSQQQQQQPSTGTSDAQSMLRVRRSTFVPGWAVSPRVLLVDDDAVSRKLGSKFLQVFGCTIDVAVDGISAVNKMNLEKYDLVLMDIVMPKMDGVSATSMIRQFDAMTPIISMTSNSKPNEIMTYYSSGMNDILPKPFTKEGLLDMLEKHLMHLKVIQQHMRSTSVSRSIGVPPLSDSGFEAAFTPGVIAAASSSASTSSSTPSNTNHASSSNTPSTATNNSNNSNSTLTGAIDLSFAMTPPPFGFDAEADGRINPLAGMGLTDEQYNMILQNIVAGEGLLAGVDVSASAGVGRREKRSREDDGDVLGIRGGGMGMGMGVGDEREGKRSRFEVVE
ncbi:hypothetical protein C0989_010169 [Termitomyces sp. Mn162]|nr:hypothetical protein C0989_010169 [Termitomyces sp. Mn162]